MNYRISEIFPSLQGEGLLQGLPVVFVRFAGCNLCCSFCDTKKAWTGGRQWTEARILARIKKFPCRRVCLTGGEPFLQDIVPLVRAMKKKGYWVAAETNGTVWRDVPLDWLTVSPKRTGIVLHPRGYDRRFARRAAEFKYVVAGAKDFDFIDHSVPCPVILQPVDNNLRKAGMIARYLTGNPKAACMLRLQMHKVVGIR